MRNIKTYVNQILDLLQEAERYEGLKHELSRQTEKLFNDYQKGKYSYFEYKKALAELLKGRSKAQWTEYYDSYIFSLMKKIELLNSQLFYDVYKDRSDLELPNLFVGGAVKPAERPAVVEQKLAEKMTEKVETKLKKLEVEKPAPVAAAKKEPSRLAARIRQLFAKKEKVSAPRTKRKLKAPRPRIPEERTPTPKYVSIGDVIIRYARRIFGAKEETYLGAETAIPRQTLELKKKRVAAPTAEAAPTAIAEEAARIKRILEKRKELKVYKPSALGTLANIAIKKLSYYLIDSFPDFFRYLYNALRLANISMLSNTYVNIMVLVSIFAFFGSFILYALFFAGLANPFIQVTLKSLLLALLTVVITFLAFYAYPFARIKARRKNIRTNLPFAINHMAAVASSGVPPAKMFKLIAESKEYGEVSVETEKIVEFVDIFGYDILTALRSVAATTPSPLMKELFNGIISTIESGGELKSYMNEKSKEAMVDYELERQKFQELISTYSDVYTGILIAAPLFFISALSLVSLLGGTIGGIAVDVLIVFGTYVIIPVLNIIFLVFLELTQPEI